MSGLRFASWEETEEYLRNQDKQEMNDAIQRGTASGWTFATKEAAIKVAETVFHHPDYDVVVYNGEHWRLNSLGQLHGPRVHEDSKGNFRVMVTLSHFEKRMDRTKMNSHNLLGIPIVIL